MAEPAADRILAPPAAGRIWTSPPRRVRFGEVDPAGRARLDALSGYVQDVASDDTVDAGLGGGFAWVVRRAVFEIHRPARFLEDLTLATWCSGIGGRWAERRVSMVGTRGASVESAILWVSLDVETGRALRITDGFRAIFAASAAGREVSARLQHPATPPEVDLKRVPWRLRATDFDMLAHVNNAASWAMVEEVLDGRAGLDAPVRFEIEYRRPVERGDEVELLVAEHDGVTSVWAVAAGLPVRSGTVFTTVRARALEG